MRGVSQQKFREVVLQVLYCRDMGVDEMDAVVQMIAHEVKVPRAVVREAWERTDAIRKRLADVDASIAKASQEYAFSRIQAVERSILRLAVYEMILEGVVPMKVAIAEAIRLSRKFSTPESGNFVNAVLDAVWRCQGAKDEP